jgi:hypothetical protein
MASSLLCADVLIRRSGKRHPSNAWNTHSVARAAAWPHHHQTACRLLPHLANRIRPALTQVEQEARNGKCKAATSRAAQRAQGGIFSAA